MVPPIANLEVGQPVSNEQFTEDANLSRRLILIGNSTIRNKLIS